jgi:hypothetical protein
VHPSIYDRYSDYGMDEKQASEGKKKFEVKLLQHPDGSIEKQIYVDDELFDYSIDISSFQEAVKMGPKFALAAKQDIARHFIHSMSEFLGRHVTIEEIKKAQVVPILPKFTRH